jgi:hypothetical protein
VGGKLLVAGWGRGKGGLPHVERYFCHMCDLIQKREGDGFVCTRARGGEQLADTRSAHPHCSREVFFFPVLQSKDLTDVDHSICLRLVASPIKVRRRFAACAFRRLNPTSKSSRPCACMVSPRRGVCLLVRSGDLMQDFPLVFHDIYLSLAAGTRV